MLTIGLPEITEGDLGIAVLLLGTSLQGSKVHQQYPDTLAAQADFAHQLLGAPGRSILRSFYNSVELQTSASN